MRALAAAPNGAVSSGAGPDTSAATAGSLASMSLGLFLLTSVLGGWASLFTPCVFPMIPITVSFFSKRAGGKRGRAVMLAWTYALGIMATFTLIGVAFSVFFGAASLANFATNVWVNLGMGTVFVALGLSLLGLFNIAAPSGLTNKIDEARGEAKNDLVMTLLMAIAFTLASFTCTVPVLGALLGLSATGGSIARPIAGMLAYSAAFAAPFFLLALFPTTLRRLPKGGAWLEVVKISMGLVEFAAALKFLSNADIGADTQILTRPVFLAIWIALFLALALYLFGILKLPGAEGEVGRFAPCSESRHSHSRSTSSRGSSDCATGNSSSRSSHPTATAANRSPSRRPDPRRSILVGIRPSTKGSRSPRKRTGAYS